MHINLSITAMIIAALLLAAAAILRHRWINRHVVWKSNDGRYRIEHCDGGTYHLQKRWMDDWSGLCQWLHAKDMVSFFDQHKGNFKNQEFANTISWARELRAQPY